MLELEVEIVKSRRISPPFSPPKAPSQSSRPRPLNIVVKAQVRVPVIVQQRLSNVRAKVLELHESVRPTVLDRLHELVHDLEVFLALDSLVLESQIELVLRAKRAVLEYKNGASWWFNLLLLTFNNSSLSVPTSIVTGKTLCGAIPPAAQYKLNFPMGMPIPFAPKSPRPRIREPSVTTARRGEPEE